MTDIETRKASASQLRGQYKEVRTLAAELEVRDNATGSTVTLEGYAAVFDSPYDMGWYTETVRSTAFDRSLTTDRNIFLLGLHEGWPMAGTAVDTLRLAPDTKGLHMKAQVAAESFDVRRMLDSITNAGVDKMSMGFRDAQPSWNKSYDQRDLVNLDLFEVSVVPIPASPSTSVKAIRKVAAEFAELRAGRTLSQASVDRLAAVLQNLVDADRAFDPLRAIVDGVDNAMDLAQAGISDLLGIPDPDPTEEDGEDDCCGACGASCPTDAAFCPSCGSSMPTDPAAGSSLVAMSGATRSIALAYAELELISRSARA